MDFEEISDEELEEENKAGIGDALGVDWASLVAESRPRVKPKMQPGSARSRWEGPKVLARLGVSFCYAGQELLDEITVKQKKEIKEEKENVEVGDKDTEVEETILPTKNTMETDPFLHPIALIHVALRERQARRKSLFATAGPYKRALSARRDLAIRSVVH
ncbi:unnamed protein product, partial [Timema podura]|nr:unnamed protein product [Timema podura]